MPSTGTGKEKVCLRCAREKECFSCHPQVQVTLALLFTLYTIIISVVHFFALKSKEKKINE